MRRFIKLMNDADAGAIIAFVLMIPFVEPQMFKSDSLLSVDILYKIMKIVSALAIAVLYLYKKRGVSSFVLLVAAVQVWIGLATVANQGSFGRYAGPAITAIATVALTEYALTVNFHKYLLLLKNLLSIYYIINLITYILLINNIYPFEYAFLGMDNRWIYFFLPWTIATFLSEALTDAGSRSKWTPWVVYCLSIGMLLIVWSAGAVFAMLMWLPVWLISSLVFQKGGRRGWICEVTTLWAGSLVGNYALLSGSLLTAVRPLLGYMHKDVTLSGRTFIWSGALKAVADNPLFGHGVQPETADGDYFYSFSPELEWTRVNHPHNTFLNNLYHGGWPAGLGYIVICSWAFLRVCKAGNCRTSRILLCGLSVFVIAALVDTLDFGPLYQVLSLVWLAPQIGQLSNSDSAYPHTTIGQNRDNSHVA